MDSFGDVSEKNGGITGAVKTFDAFPKTRVSYTRRSSRGGFTTIFLVFVCIVLVWFEFGSFLDGHEEQEFLVDKLVHHDMQINLDIVVAMPCDSLHVNVQDAAGDRILAGELLTKQGAHFDESRTHRLALNLYQDHDVEEVLRKAKKQKWRTPQYMKQHQRQQLDMSQACRIWGSMEVNRVLGDFHITAKGHGYWEPGQHVEHNTFNFSHVINEFSFGEYYPRLFNPLDGVVAGTDERFYKFQYFLSVVPTTYISHTFNRWIFTNQYSVTESPRSTNPHNVPGIFFKYDIEPVSLEIHERRTPFIQFMVKIINIIGGVLVGGGWIYKGGDYAWASFFGRQRRRASSAVGGMINGNHDDAEEDEY